MKWRSTLLVLACACVLAAPAEAAKPKPKAPAAPVALKILPTATLNSLTGGNFVIAPLGSGEKRVPFGASWNGTASDYSTPPDSYTQNPYAHDLSFIFFVGASSVARAWSSYTHPRGATATLVPGIGTKAVEANDYIMVVKGQIGFQMWAGNNGGQHLSYAQLETVAKYIVSKLT
jgi:hypothetical protein